MRLDSLKHLARVVAATSEAERVIVFGSASLLPTFPDLGDDFGGPLTKTFDADFIPTPFEEEMGQLLDATFGKDHRFHVHFGYYADIVRPFAFEDFPKGWEERLVPLPDVERVFCLEPHDMAAAKCQAGRLKDIELLALLFSTGRLDPAEVKERLYLVPMREAMIVRSHNILKEAVARSMETPGTGSGPGE
ncbi:DUF6036 family nucleotidyltransferase [Luteolibacter sp. Populi]|uniref:DUF6036 family nucleotidyltransferase n=1 Tax=Luteolibacter sp. Populi TaxID=3230487 RepID=UPI003465EB3D